MTIYDKVHYTINNEHGLGVLFNINSKANSCQSFFEDGTIETLKMSADQTESLNYLIYIAENRWNWIPEKEKVQVESLVKNADCRFYLNEKGNIAAQMTVSQKTFDLCVTSSEYRRAAVCTCKETNCIHAKAAGRLLKERMKNLEHSYVTFDGPVNKSLLLESSLTQAIEILDERDIDHDLVEAEKSIIQMVESANSDEYYQLLHEWLLMLSDYDYDAHFLEENYAFLLLSLFDTPRYQTAVLASGTYADPINYEYRQRRSNRTCLKRVLKDYNSVNKAMDVRKDFSCDLYKEYLLKYRGDNPRLMHYYAVGKEELEIFDFAFLDEIAQLAETDPAAIRHEDIAPVMVKLDKMNDHEHAISVFHRFAALLPHDELIQVYSKLENIHMNFDEIQKMPMEEQRKLIYQTPLSPKSISHILDNVLAGDSDREKGLFILNSAAKFLASGSTAQSQSLLQRAALLPDSRLLMSCISHVMRTSTKIKPPKGTPEKEISTYFDCSYEIVNQGGSFYTEYTVSVPDSDIILFLAKEASGKLTPTTCSSFEIKYPSSVIRELCLRGREKEYKEQTEKTQEAVDAYLFEQNNKKFVNEYRQLCDSLVNEKLLFTENAKASIEWLLYRDDVYNAVAFRVGQRKKYIVKDAPEFLKAFRTGQTFTYGKDLILTHDTDNLEDTDATAIKMLMSANFTKGIHGDRSNKRYISIGNVLMGNLLDILAGRTVFFNDRPCLLRMNPVKVRLKVGGDYVLSTDLDGKTQTFMNLQGKGYVLSQQPKDGSQFIDRLDGTQEEANLVDLVNRNPSVSIKSILPDFRKKIYSRFFDMMDVDKTVQKDFLQSQLLLSTYFDYERSTITAKTVISRDGKEIPADKLPDRIDQQKYDLLQNYLGALGFVDGVIQDEGHILSFFKLDFSRLKKLTNVYLSENLQNKELRSVGKPVIRVSYQNNLVSVFLEKSDYDDEDMEQILAALRKKKKFILLSGNRIVDLDSEAARDLGEAVKDFGMDPKALHKKKTISMINAIKAFSHERSCSIDKYLKGMIEEIRSFKEADIEAPQLEADLRDYQTEGYRWLSVLSKYHMGGILADDMGLGKTIQVIALLRADNTKKPSLVVCPKSLVFNWVSEFARFDGVTKVAAIYGLESQRSQVISQINYREKAVYITSYDSLRNDIEKYKGGFNYAILDEAQYIKNIHAQKTKSVKELKAEHRFALTGTPIENSVVDLWSIFDYIMPGYFEELSQFKDSDPSAIARKAAPFILRRVKEDVLDDLPAKYETILSADMSSEQRKIYEAMKLDARQHLESGGKAFDILPYLTRLRQVCVDPGMFVEDYQGGSGKLDMLKSLIPTYLEENHRILIFSQFVKALESVRALLEQLGIPSYFLSGATPAEERIRMMDSFNNGSGTDVFLISLKAGGTGLNLTGADTVIHLDPWWNVAAENQASDRTHRIGQTRNVEVIKLIAGDSIEQRVIELQNIKKEVIKQVISDNDGSVTSASLEDIAFVLE